MMSIALHVCSSADSGNPASELVLASNDVIRTQVVRHYRQFVAEVEPRGGVMDHLIEAGIVNIETKDRVTGHVTRQVRPLLCNLANTLLVLD